MHVQFIKSQKIWELHDHHLINSILEDIWTSRNSSTVQKYCYALRKMIGYFILKDTAISLPLTSIIVAQYITHLRHLDSTKGSIDCISASCKWINSFIPGVNRSNDSLNDDFLHRVINSAQRALSKPKMRKKPMTGEILKDILDYLKPSDLKSYRNALVPCLAYTLLLRYDELSHINCSHISETSEYYRFYIPSAKNDQLRGGRETFLPKTVGKYSVSKLLENYLSMAKLGIGMNHFLLCQIRHDSFRKDSNVLNVILSYTSCREIVKTAISAIGLDPGSYAMHSARSGGATDLAAHATLHKLQQAGRWNDPRSVGHYVETPIERRLHLAKALSLDD